MGRKKETPKVEAKPAAPKVEKKEAHGAFFPQILDPHDLPNHFDPYREAAVVRAAVVDEDFAIGDEKDFVQCEAGDYLLVHPDGHVDALPADLFEVAYVPVAEAKLDTKGS
jgi:hypothetical protein